LIGDQGEYKVEHENAARIGESAEVEATAIEECCGDE
jgi:hypothetical protein